MPELPFTLDQLRILKAIAAQGSFKKAADLLYVTQPAVSLQIQNLEKQLEITIFDRYHVKMKIFVNKHSRRISQMNLNFIISIKINLL